eukprot:gnl/Chilomastix_caulleri/5766.p1 GENE.gnl/Chilomastix_caulleri/5766~~gnl/Chilomastix_caulleri/5766.p1  ORF type:complete len:57 (+),score=5.13 gnl/Chilomastix_caulleri/5766:95-265(+)
MKRSRSHSVGIRDYNHNEDSVHNKEKRRRFDSFWTSVLSNHEVREYLRGSKYRHLF